MLYVQTCSYDKNVTQYKKLNKNYVKINFYNVKQIMR